MTACNRLRIDRGDGSAVMEYRIQDGAVESRTVISEAGKNADTGWHQLTPADIRSHVYANTVLARWLRYRMGLHKLIRACNPEFCGTDRHTDEVAA